MSISPMLQVPRFGPCDWVSANMTDPVAGESDRDAASIFATIPVGFGRAGRTAEAPCPTGLASIASAMAAAPVIRVGRMDRIRHLLLYRRFQLLLRTPITRLALLWRSP